MKDMHPEVLELPHMDGEKPCRGYSQTQVKALQGRSFATKANGSVRVGNVVGSYAYRYDGRRVEYGLETEFKLNGSREVWKGSLNRTDVERDGNTALLRGETAKQVQQQMKQDKQMTPAVVKSAKQAVSQSQAKQASQGQGMSF